MYPVWIPAVTWAVSSDFSVPTATSRSSPLSHISVKMYRSDKYGKSYLLLSVVRTRCVIFVWFQRRLRCFGKIFPKLCNIKFRENRFSGFEITCGEKEKTDTLMPTCAFLKAFVVTTPETATFPELRGGLISLWLYKENNKLRDWKNIFTLHIPPWAPHTYDFVVLTSLTHPRKILLVVLQIGK
jgi:hypothetical protein